jgi:hypothetical protein
MTRLRIALFAAALFVYPTLGQAQDFGVMESAETINQGNFKLKVNPMFLLGDSDTTGVAGSAGYGFTPRFDAEFNLAAYDGVTLFGGNVEYWLLKGDPRLDVSGSLGFHYANRDFGDETGIDLNVIASHHLTPRLDIYGALDMAFNKFRDDFPNNDYTQAHLVPGIEYKLHDDLDLLAEVGLSLNDNGDEYLSIGVAYYLR